MPRKDSSPSRMGSPSSGEPSESSRSSQQAPRQGLEAFRQNLRSQQQPTVLPAQTLSASPVADESSQAMEGERNLRGASEQMVQLLLAHGTAPLAIFDENLRLLEASKRWFEVLGLEAERAHFRSLDELLPGKALSWREEIDSVFAGKRSIKQAELLQREDGGYDWVQWSLNPWWRSGEVAGLILNGMVLTEQLEREQVQEPALVLGQGLLDEVQLAVVALNARGQLRYANEGALRLLGGQVQSGGVFSHCLDSEQAVSWQYGLQKMIAQWRTQGLALDSKQLELYWHDGRVLQAWQLPWQEQEQVRGVLLLIWPEGSEALEAVKDGEDAPKVTLGKEAVREFPEDGPEETLPLAQLEEFQGEPKKQLEQQGGLSLLQENVPDLFAAAMAVCTAEGEVLWSNEAWRSLPAQTTEVIWPRAGAGAFLPALDAASEGVEVLMIPLGAQTSAAHEQNQEVEHWLAVARAERAQEGGSAQVKELEEEQQARLGKFLQQREQELDEAQKLAQLAEGERDQVQRQLEESWLELRDLRTQAQQKQQELEGRLRSLEQERFGLKQRLKELVVGHEHFVSKVRKQRQEIEQQLQRSRASTEDAQLHLLDAVAEIGKLREQFDCLNLPVLTLSQLGKVQTHSAEMERMFGAAPEEGERILDWLVLRAPDEDQENEIRLMWENRLWPERCGEMIALLWDGQGMVREFQLRLQQLPSSVKSGKASYLLAFQDVGEMGQQARSLESFKQRYETLMNQVPLGVALVAPGRGIVEANERLANWFGCRKRALRGVYLESLVPVESLATTLRTVLQVCHEPGASVKLRLSMRPPRASVQQAREVSVRLSTAMQQGGEAQLQLCLFELPEE